jgi:CO/xanthine dehydrogenase Mo-binding subunit
MWLNLVVFVETVFMIETIMEHVASVLQLPADAVREINMYKPGDTTICGQHLNFCNVREVLSALKVQLLQIVAKNNLYILCSFFFLFFFKGFQLEQVYE